MLIGVPKEIKAEENRVGLVSDTVRLVAGGHHVEIEKRAGEGAGITDEEYVAAGAQIVETPERIFDRAQLIVKLKEALAVEHQPEDYACAGDDRLVRHSCRIEAELPVSGRCPAHQRRRQSSHRVADVL